MITTCQLDYQLDHLHFHLGTQTKTFFQAAQCMETINFRTSHTYIYLSIYPYETNSFSIIYGLILGGEINVGCY